MAEQYCTRMLDFSHKLVLHRRGFVLGLCVLNVVFSLVATLGNLLVIRALMKASTIPLNVKKMFLSLAFSDLAVGLLSQLMYAIIHAVILKMVSSGENLASFCPTVLSVLYYFSSLLATASFLNVIVIAVDRPLAVSLHLRYRELITSKRVTKVLLFLWLTSCIIASMLIFLPKGNEKVAVAILLVGYVLTTVAYVRILPSCQISSESDLHSKSASKRPNKGSTPTKEVRLYCFICLSCFSSLFFSCDTFYNIVFDKHF